MDPILGLLISIAGQTAPWSKPVTDDAGDYWTHNSYMEVPKDRWLYHYVNAQQACSALFGKGDYSGGCVNYTPDDNVGLYADIYLDKDAPRRLQSRLKAHEERHAEGWVHPWPGFSKQYPEYNQ